MLAYVFNYKTRCIELCNMFQGYQRLFEIITWSYQLWLLLGHKPQPAYQELCLVNNDTEICLSLCSCGLSNYTAFSL